MTSNLFQQLRNAVLDLQAATLQSFDRPLKRIAALLENPELSQINATLTEGLDLDAFLAEGNSSGGGMAGSKSLPWPEEVDRALGLSLLLLIWLGRDPRKAIGFTHSFYYGGSKVMAGIQNMTRQLIIPFLRDYEDYVNAKGSTQVRVVRPKSDRIFVVHGHDGEARESIARFIEQLGFSPIVLHEQASRGKTVIEKVEAHSDVGFAIVLLTPDDEGRTKGSEQWELRPRQNVLLELGYFIARLGRENVCTLRRGDVAIPSDFAGVVWTSMDNSAAWRLELGKELEAAGYGIDWNKVMGRNS